MIALIMAGGIGTRFWPLSTKNKPKQFLNILGNRSMIQQTVDRISSQTDYKNIYVVTNYEQKELVKEHLPQLPAENIIAEPVGRNTAACIGLGAILLSDKYTADETMLVLPADHYIGKPEKFLEIVSFASRFAKESKNLITFGIKPTFPATGYGYIESEEKITDGKFPIYTVKRFKEKPDLETAKAFVSSGYFFWNSGMFLWRIDAILDAIQKYMPALFLNLTKIKELLKNKRCSKIKEIYQNLESIPIDIGIMEKAENATVIPIDIDWNDIGSWQAVYDLMPKDENGNCFTGNIINHNSKNNYILSENKKKTIALAGVENLIIVDTKEALLICKKEKSQDVKKIVEILTLKKQDE
ncbi:MAG: mannose-1-phosphate guanylyltransferase [Candidatus Cloacimonetes bacterium]|nr:mannose-1-phosphate guanylyltransferase [Candidatus Cloacimonadota bacterium]MBL7085922.1 mannose-1-phosphate guanylyltransferase [Candidatus Cloacimonadota bacterium]